jgi:hypothetical protein
MKLSSQLLLLLSASLICVTSYSDPSIPAATDTLHMFDQVLYGDLTANVDTDYAQWNDLYNGYSLGLAALANSYKLNPCSPDFDSTLPGLQEVTPSKSATVKAGAVSIVACLTADTTQTDKNGSDGSFINLGITGPIAPKQPQESVGINPSVPAIMAGYVEPTQDGNLYSPKSILQNFYTEDGTYSYSDMHVLGKASTQKPPVFYIYQNPDNVGDRLPNVVNPTTVYPSDNLIYDNLNDERSADTVKYPAQPWRDAYPFLIQLNPGSTTPTNNGPTPNTWEQIYTPFDNSNPAPNGLTAAVALANNALTSTFTPVYVYDQSGAAPAIERVTKVGYYTITPNTSPVTSNSPIYWVPPAVGSTDTYQLTFWIKPADSTTMDQLKDAFSCGTGQEGAVFVKDQNAPQGGSLVVDGQSNTVCISDGDWLRVSQQYNAYSVIPAYPTLEAAPAKTAAGASVSYSVTDFGLRKTSGGTPTSTYSVTLGIDNTTTSLLISCDDTTGCAPSSGGSKTKSLAVTLPINKASGKSTLTISTEANVCFKSTGTSSVALTGGSQSVYTSTSYCKTPASSGVMPTPNIHAYTNNTNLAPSTYDAYDFNTYNLQPTNPNASYPWRLRNAGVGSSTAEAHTGSLGSNIEYVNSDVPISGQTAMERVVRFRNFGGDDDSTIFNEVLSGTYALPPGTPDALGYNTGERQGGVMASSKAYGNADYVLCVRFPRQSIGVAIEAAANPTVGAADRGTYYPYNTGGVTAIWPYHYTTLSEGMIGYNDSSQAVLRNSEIDIEIPAFDGNTPQAPYRDSIPDYLTDIGITAKPTNFYSYRPIRMNSWGGDFSGYGNNLSARPDTPMPQSSDASAGNGLDDGQFHQLTIETVADTQTTPGFVRWYYNPKCTVETQMRTDNAHVVTHADLGSVINMSDNTENAGVIIPTTMGLFQPVDGATNGEWQGFLPSSGFDNVPHQAMQLTLGIWTPTVGTAVDYDASHENVALGWGGTTDYIDEDHAGYDERFSPHIYTGAASFRCGPDKSGKESTDTIADGFDSDCSKFIPVKYVSYATPTRTAFLQAWATQMYNWYTGTDSYNLPAFNPARDDDVFINPYDMTDDTTKPINVLLTKASFGLTAAKPLPTNWADRKANLIKFDNERDTDVSSIYIVQPPGYSAAPDGVLSTYNTDDFKDQASCANTNYKDTAEEWASGCTYNPKSIYQFPKSDGTLILTTYPIDPTQPNK